MLLYTYISRFSVTPYYIKSGRVAATNAVPQPFLIAVSTSRTNGPRLLSRVKAGTHSPSPTGSHTAAYTPKQGTFRMGRYHYPRHELHVHEHPRAGYQNGVLCRFWVLVGRCSRRTQRACGTAMRLCMSLFRGVEAPLSCVAFFRFCRNYGFHTLRSGLSVCARRGGWYHYPRCALRVVETLDGRLSKRLICRFLGLTCSSLTAAQNTVLFGHGIPTEKRLNRQRLIPPPAGRCGSNTAVSRSPGLSRGPRCPAPARTPQVSAPAP